MRHEVMDYMFKKPSMLDDLDVTFKSDSARKVLFFYQVKHYYTESSFNFNAMCLELQSEQQNEDDQKKNVRIKRSQRNISVMQKKEREAERKKAQKKNLFTTDGLGPPLLGTCMYFIRTSTR